MCEFDLGRATWPRVSPPVCTPRRPSAQTGNVHHTKQTCAVFGGFNSPSFSRRSRPHKPLLVRSTLQILEYELNGIASRPRATAPGSSPLTKRTRGYQMKGGRQTSGPPWTRVRLGIKSETPTRTTALILGKIGGASLAPATAPRSPVLCSVETFGPPRTLARPGVKYFPARTLVYAIWIIGEASFPRATAPNSPPSSTKETYGHLPTVAISGPKSCPAWPRYEKMVRHRLLQRRH